MSFARHYRPYWTRRPRGWPLYLTLEQEDVFKEILNIGLGQAADSLNQMLETPIILNIPTILLAKVSELQMHFQEFGDQPLSIVQLSFEGSYAGSATLAFPKETARKLVEILTGQIMDEKDLDAMKVAILTEIGNIVLNGIMGSITNMLGSTINYSVPTYNEFPVTTIFQSSQQNDSTVFLWVKTRLTAMDCQISGDIFLVFDSNCFDTLLEGINNLLGQPT